MIKFFCLAGVFKICLFFVGFVVFWVFWFCFEFFFSLGVFFGSISNSSFCLGESKKSANVFLRIITIFPKIKYIPEHPRCFPVTHVKGWGTKYCFGNDNSEGPSPCLAISFLLYFFIFVTCKRRKHSPSLRADVIRKVNRVQPSYKGKAWVCVARWGCQASVLHSQQMYSYLQPLIRNHELFAPMNISQIDFITLLIPCAFQTEVNCNSWWKIHGGNSGVWRRSTLVCIRRYMIKLASLAKHFHALGRCVNNSIAFGTQSSPLLCCTCWLWDKALA